MQLQNATSDGGRRDGSYEADGSSTVVGGRSPFDRAAPARSRTVRCESVAGGRRWRRLLPRSQSVNHIDCLAASNAGVDAHVTSPPEDRASRFRRRLDEIRANLVARVHARKPRGDNGDGGGGGGGRTKDDRSDRPEAVVDQSEPAAAESVWNGGADEEAQDVSVSSSSPTKTVFDRRRVHRRTPRRHRTVVDGQQVETAMGPTLLRRGASGASREATATWLPKFDDVVRQQASRLADDPADVISDVTSDVTTTDADTADRNDSDVRQLQNSRQVCRLFLYGPRNHIRRCTPSKFSPNVLLNRNSTTAVLS